MKQIMANITMGRNTLFGVSEPCTWIASDPTTNPTQQQALAGISWEAYSYFNLIRKTVTLLL